MTGDSLSHQFWQRLSNRPPTATSLVISRSFAFEQEKSLQIGDPEALQRTERIGSTVRISSLKAGFVKLTIMKFTFWRAVRGPAGTF